MFEVQQHQKRQPCKNIIAFLLICSLLLSFSSFSLAQSILSLLLHWIMQRKRTYNNSFTPKYGHLCSCSTLWPSAYFANLYWASRSIGVVCLHLKIENFHQLGAPLSFTLVLFLRNFDMCISSHLICACIISSSGNF